MKEPQSHWWLVDGRYTACGIHVTRDMVCSPSPSCEKCREWLVADAKVLETFLANDAADKDVKRWTYD